MPIHSAHVILPAERGMVSVLVKRTADLKLVGFEVEPVDDPMNHPPRYMVVFYAETSGDPSIDAEDIHSTDLIDDPALGDGTSFSAIVVVGQSVVARDRKRVRNGVSEMG